MPEIKDSDKFRIQIASTILAEQIRDKLFQHTDPALDRYIRQSLITADHLIEMATSNKDYEHG